MREDEFFIGYAPPMPPRLVRFVTRAVLTVAGAVAAWAVIAAAGHVSLEGGTFEFGHPTTVSGRLIERPYPALQVDTVDRSLSSLLLLVAPGKHGADALVRGMNGQRVTVSGTRIQRDAHTMIEIDPASLAGGEAAKADAAGIRLPADDLGDFELTGEIVDSKCFLGVMVPGSGKTHADCASLCIRGGMPPALHVQNFSGRSELLLLTGPADEPIHAEAVAAAGQTVTMHGSVSRRGGWLFLKVAQGFSAAMRRSR